MENSEKEGRNKDLESGRIIEMTEAHRATAESAKTQKEAFKAISDYFNRKNAAQNDETEGIFTISAHRHLLHFS